MALNVGGKRHEVRWDTLDKFPNSRLGRLRHSASHRGKKIKLLMSSLLQSCISQVLKQLIEYCGLCFLLLSEIIWFESVIFEPKSATQLQ